MLTAFNYIAEQVFCGDGDFDGCASVVREKKTMLLNDDTTMFPGDETTIFSGDETRLSSIDETQTSLDNDDENDDENDDDDDDDMRAMHKQKDERPNLQLLPPSKIPTPSLIQDGFDLMREDSLVASVTNDDDASIYVTIENGNIVDDAISVCSGITCGGSVATGTVTTATCEGGAADDGMTTDPTNVAASAEATNFGCMQNTEEEIEHKLKEAIAAMLRSYAYCNDAGDAGSVATKIDCSTTFTPNSSVSKLFANSTSAEALNEDEAMGNTAVKDRYTHNNPGEDPSKRHGPIKPTSDREEYFLSNPSMESAASALYAEIEPAVKVIKKIKEAKKEVDPDTTTQDLNPNVSSIRQTMVDVKEQGLLQVINNTLFGSTEAVAEIVDVLEEKGLFKSVARLLTFLDEDAQKRFTQQVIPDLGEVGLLNTMMHLVVDSCCCRIEQDVLDEQEYCNSVAELALSTQSSSGGTCTKKSNLSEGASETVPECSAPVANASQCSPDTTKKSDLSKDACDPAPKEWHPSIEIIYNPGRKARMEKKRGKVALRKEDSLAVSSNSNRIRYRIPISTGVAVATTSDSIENSDTANDTIIVFETDDGFEVMEKGRRNKTLRAVPMFQNAPRLLNKFANKASSTTINNNKEGMNDGGDGKADALVRKRKEEQEKAAKLAEEKVAVNKAAAEELNRREAEATAAKKEALRAAKEQCNEEARKQKQEKKEEEKRATALAKAEAKRIEAETLKAAKYARHAAALVRAKAKRIEAETLEAAKEARRAAALTEAKAKRIEADTRKATIKLYKEEKRLRQAELKQSLAEKKAKEEEEEEEEEARRVTQRRQDQEDSDRVCTATNRDGYEYRHV